MLNYESVCVPSMYMCVYSHAHFDLHFIFTAVGKHSGRGLGISMVCLDTEGQWKVGYFHFNGVAILSFLVAPWQMQCYLQTSPTHYTFWP